METSRPIRRLAAIMFTDMVGFTALAQRNEHLALDLHAEQQHILRSHFARHDGSEIKSTGDGFLVEFPSALEAVQCAIEIQKALASRNATQPPERHFKVRIGVHVGEAVHRDGDVMGDGVNIASRIEPLAVPGGICISETAYAQVHNKCEERMTRIDASAMKNVRDPIGVYRVVLPWESLAEKKAPNRKSAVQPGRLPVIAVALALLGLLLVGTKSLLARRPSATPASSHPTLVPASDQKSVAVLPFVNMSAEKDNEYLSDGITEELLNALSRVPGLRVPARTSAFSFKGKNENIKKIAELLNVSTVLEGSVRRAGNRLRISAQFIDAATGYHLWSEEYDRPLSNVFAVEDEITKSIVDRLKLSLGPQSQKHPVNLAAWEMYLRGRFHLLRYTEHDARSAVDYFRKAIKLQPDFADAYAGLSYAYGYVTNYSDPVVLRPLVRAASTKALALDDSCALAHDARSNEYCSFDLNFPAAEVEVKRAIDLDPNLVEAHKDYSELLYAFGRYREALAENAICVRLDPLNPSVHVYTAILNCFLGDLSASKQAFARAKLLDPNYVWLHEWIGACLFCFMNKRAAGIAEMEVAVRLGRDPSRLAAVGNMYARVGRKVDAYRILETLNKLRAKQHVDAACFVWVYEGLGDYERANEWMNRAISERDGWLMNLRAYVEMWKASGNPYRRQWLKKIGLDL